MVELFPRTRMYIIYLISMGLVKGRWSHHLKLKLIWGCVRRLTARAEMLIVTHG